MGRTAYPLPPWGSGGEIDRAIGGWWWPHPKKPRQVRIPAITLSPARITLSIEMRMHPCRLGNVPDAGPDPPAAKGRYSGREGGSVSGSGRVLAPIQKLGLITVLGARCRPPRGVVSGYSPRTRRGAAPSRERVGSLGGPRPLDPAYAGTPASG